MFDLQKLIARAVQKADPAPEDELGFVTAETPDGMVEKIWYRTMGDENQLVRCEEVTLEEWEWEKHGCSNNEEWRAYLNKMFWAGL